MRISITLENVGRFFEDYVVKDGEELLGVYSSARRIPKKYRKEFLDRLHKDLKATPNEAAALLGIASEWALR